MTTELNKLFPLPTTLQVNGVDLSITPFKLGELPRVFKVVEPITQLIMNALRSSDDQMKSLSEVVIKGGDNILDLIALGARQPRTWVDGLDMDQGVVILVAILEVNSSFFVQRVLPQILKAAPAVSQAGQVL